MSVRVYATAAAVFASLAVTASASAGVSFVPFGAGLPAGETLITDFATLSGDTGTGVLDTNSQNGISAAPAFIGGPDTASYLSVQGNESETVSLPWSREVSVYVGSLDPYNTITFGGPGAAIYTGGDLTLTGAVDDGNQTASSSNGRFIFDFASPVTSITFSSSANAFEVASVAAVVPEPAAWALMLVGFGGTGVALRSRRKIASAA